MTEPTADRLPVTVLTGFLGSGKTTLLNRLVALPELADTAVLVNELGEIGLDHLLVENSRDTVLLLDSGCLCCAITDSLGETLADIHRRRAQGSVPPFSRVVIETTGLADPAPILRALMRDPLIRPFYAVGAVVCTADAVHGIGQLDRHAEARAQVALADRIVVTKSDVDDASPGDLRARIAALNGQATLSDGVSDREIPLLLADAIKSHESWPDSEHVHHDAAITSVSLKTPIRATRSGVTAWTAALRLMLGNRLLRCKALIEMEGDPRPLVLHGVQTVFDMQHLPGWPDDQRGARIVCIAEGLEPDRIRASLSLLAFPEGAHPPTRIEELGF